MIDTFPGVISFAFLTSMLLAGTVLRARLRLLQRGLVPACLIGGAVGFVLINTDLSLGYSSQDFTAFTFHFFTLSFMSLVLTGKKPDETDKTEATQQSSTLVKGGSWLACIWVASLALQALVGAAVIAVYNGVTGTDVALWLGAIATHGFTQGPGQALALGGIWETEFLIANASAFGLIYASVGFISAFLVGVPIARYLVSHNLHSNQAARINPAFEIGLLHPRAADDSQTAPVSAGNQVTHPANVDSLGYHLGLLGVAYLITDQYLRFFAPLTEGVQLGPVHMGVFFSHNLFFFHGLLVCLLLRQLLNATGLARYFDVETQQRITGTSVDLMVTATIMSIQFALLGDYLAPILLVCLSVTVATAILCFGMGRLLPSLGPERALTAFGCCCGSTGSGLVLLRILDPDFSTPIARELAFFNVAIMFVGLHILSIMAPVMPAFSWTLIISVYGLTVIACLAAMVWLQRGLPGAARASVSP